MKDKKVYTVGHSKHTIAYFVELIKSQKINCVVDVRSVAASRYNPQFNKAFLHNFLQNQGITYLHFDKEFGARQADPSVLDEDNKVNFEKFRETSAFKNGVNRLEQGIEKGFTIALMCSEADPMDCHRFVMITAGLKQFGFTINHILKDKTIMTNADLEAELLKKFAKKLPQPTIFEPLISTETQLMTAYRLRNKQIGWSPDVEETESL
jgi:uncharacterized protein (DUF488 family)